MSNLKTSLSIQLLLLIAAITSYGQDKSAIKQESDKSTCSNIVALAGNVNLNCSSLTPDQKKLIAKIPTLLNKLLVNQADPKVISDKLDDILEALSRLNQPSTVNYAPGGFATSGGMVVNPQVNNYRDPLPPIDVTPSTPIAAESKPDKPPQFNVRMGQFPLDPNIYRPGASVVVTVRGPFRNPAFTADCDVPCTLTDQSFLTTYGSTSNTDQAEPFSLSATTAGITYNIQMRPGFRIRLVFRSNDDRPLTVSNVRPYDPNQ
jgi:hypothetical protein